MRADGEVDPVQVFEEGADLEHGKALVRPYRRVAGQGGQDSFFHGSGFSAYSAGAVGEAV